MDSEQRERQKKEASSLPRTQSASESESLSEDSDFTENQNSYEKKLNILHIPHIILWKTINEKQLKL